MIARTLLLVVAAGCLLAHPAPARSSSGSTLLARTLGPVQDVSFPFWCDWGYDWDERCYRDDSDRLPIGGDSDKVWRAGLRFSLASIPADAVVLEASVSVYHDGTCLAPRKTSRECPARSYWLDLHPIVGSWFDEREPAYGPTLGRAVLTDAKRPGWLSWDVTGLVEEWLSGNVRNDGVLVKLADEHEELEVTGPSVPSSTFDTAVVRPALDVVYVRRTPADDEGHCGRGR